MKTILALLLAACLLTGCGGDGAETPTWASAAAATEATHEAEEPSGGIDTVVLLQSKHRFVEYALTALNPYGQYAGDNGTINGQGAEALAKYLLREQVLEEAAAFQEGLFLPAEDVPVYDGWIGKATEQTKAVRLMTTVNVAESGLLEGILSGFTEEFGYTVEVIPKKEEEVYLCAGLGEADLVLAPIPAEGDSGNFRQLPGFSLVHIPLLRCPYVLCGPEADPAGVGKIEDAHVSLTDAKLRSALLRIAETECYFISRSDGSAAHQAELELWTETPEGDWYFAADTEMGPCLTIAEEMGGYVLCDALTYEIFRALNGIV